MPVGPTNSSDRKAVLVIKPKSGAQTRIPVHFNPEKYAIQRTINYDQKPAGGRDQPTTQFKGGGPNKMTLALMFDTTDQTNKDVRDYIKPLWDAAKIDSTATSSSSGMSEPPHVIFIWGRSWSFEAVINSLSTEFVLFNSDGMPIRANVSLGLTQVVDDTSFGRQNPTSGALDGKIHLVREGDRMDLLANQYYRKPMLWRYIAEHNDIDNPRNLKPGTRLIIPPLP